MLRFGVYVLFVLACVLPGWYLRDIVAAEVQLRLSEAEIRLSKPHEFSRRESRPYKHPASYRRLGPSGQAYLITVSLQRAQSSDRGSLASGLLYTYDSPMIARWFLDQCTCPDADYSRWATLYFEEDSHEKGIRDCMMRVSEADLNRVFRSLHEDSAPVVLLGYLWEEQAEVAERVAVRWIRETDDARAVSRVAGYYLSRSPSNAERRLSSEARKRTLSAGLESQDPWVAKWCSHLLDAREREREGN